MKETFRSYSVVFFFFLLTLPVYFWRFSFDFGTQLHHLFCHPSAVVKHRDDAQDEVCTDVHARTVLLFWVSLCPKGIGAVDELQHMNIMTEWYRTDQQAQSST